MRLRRSTSALPEDPPVASVNPILVATFCYRPWDRPQPSTVLFVHVYSVFGMADNAEMHSTPPKAVAEGDPSGQQPRGQNRGGGKRKRFGDHKLQHGSKNKRRDLGRREYLYAFDFSTTSISTN